MPNAYFLEKAVKNSLSVGWELRPRPPRFCSRLLLHLCRVHFLH